jgi:hypothetical protein
MKLSDLENATKAQSILKRLDKNIIKIEDFLSKEPRSDCGGIDGILEYGYNCYVSQYRDRSDSSSLDLSGCYVQYQVYRATLKVLQDQREIVIAYLKSINVEVEEETE